VEEIMSNMPEIIAACITGFCMFLTLFIQNVMLSRRRKIEDVASVIIPRRAELYREFLKDICGTGIQYKYDIGEDSKAEKIVFLHELCNRAIYELCPFASKNVLEHITKLSEACAKHRPLIVEAVDNEVEEKWRSFTFDFKMPLFDILYLIRSDCMGDPIDSLVEDAKRRKHIEDKRDIEEKMKQAYEQKIKAAQK
jgi:hypothetical protein